MNISIKEPVLDWMNLRKINYCPLDHEVAFGMGQTSIIIRSNKADIIKKVKQAFRFYPNQHKNLITDDPVIMEIICIGSMAGSAGINFPSSWNVEPVMSLSFNANDVCLDEFINYKINTTECFWRPTDMMISVPTQYSRTIRLICCDFVEKKGKKRYECIGGESSDPYNVDEIIDLIKILYVRSQKQYCVHGATVALGNYGVFITGNSGLGKTTTALAAVRGGFDLLSDELTLIGLDTEDSVDLQGLLIPPAIVGQVPQYLDSLENTLTVSENIDQKNSYILTDNIVQAGRYRSVTPASILFLYRPKTPDVSHRLIPMSEQKALQLLMEQVLDFNCPFRLKKRFKAVTSLIASCPSYTLRLGMNLRSLPDIIRTSMKGKSIV